MVQLGKALYTLGTSVMVHKFTRHHASLFFWKPIKMELYRAFCDAQMWFDCLFLCSMLVGKDTPARKIIGDDARYTVEKDLTLL